MNALVNPKGIFEGLGFVARPLFRSLRNVSHKLEPVEPESLLILDGVRASFALSLTEQRPAKEDNRFYDWAWSCHVPNHVEIVIPPDQRDGVVRIRRWDDPGRLREISSKALVDSAGAFVLDLEREGPGRGRSVIAHALRLFRLMREVAAFRSADPAAIQAFHALLVAASRLDQSDANLRYRWNAAESLRQILALTGVANPLLKGDIKLAGLQKEFITPEATSGRILNPSLLLEHAMGALYQEAHLEVERDAQLFLFAPQQPTRHTAVVERHIVYTPASLARLLADMAWRALNDAHPTSSHPVILDPACGSGVFLAEAARSLPASVAPTLLGFDVSEAAITMARLALDNESHITAPTLKTTDALVEPWPDADIVLMNPPFISWEDLTSAQRERVRASSGVVSGRPDIAMAFISLAVRKIRPGGVIATILPSSLLESGTGSKWRQQLLSDCWVKVIGRFQGTDLFPTAMVEPAALVLQKKYSGGRVPDHTQVLVSAPGYAESAIRALRVSEDVTVDGQFEVFKDSAIGTNARSWMPVPRSARILVADISAGRSISVEHAFDVRQGIRSGADKVFVLSSEAFRRLPKAERRYFRPLAGNRTIVDGKIVGSQYIFFPYDEDGSCFSDVKQLRKAVPTFFAERLTNAKTELAARARAPARWWELMWPRTWQFEQLPRIVSSYFGESGKFSLDESGACVVGQGYAWIIKQSAIKQAVISHLLPRTVDSEAATRALGPIWVAVFNSGPFEALLGVYAPRVLGGQFDLSPRFINSVPIPNLFDGLVPISIINRLRKIGQDILQNGLQQRRHELDSVVADAYGVSLDRWPIEHAL